MRWVLGLFFALRLVHAQEAELRWKVGQLGAPEARRIVLTEEAPLRLIVPEDLEATAFARIPFGDTAELAIALTDTGFRVDTDFDSDLSDEVTSEWLGLGTRRYRGVHLKVPYKGESAPAEIDILLTLRTDGTQPRLWITTRCYRIGEIEAGGRLRPCALVDGNGDLRFDHPTEDFVYIDVNGDARLDTTAGSFERIRLGVPFALRRTGHELTSVAANGARLTLAPREQCPAPTARTWKPLVSRSIVRKASRRTTIAAARKKIKQAIDLHKTRSYDYGLISALQFLGDVGTAEAFTELRRMLGKAKRAKNPRYESWVVSGMGYSDFKQHAAYVAGIARKSKHRVVRSAAYTTLARMGADEGDTFYARRLLKEKDAGSFALLARYLAETGTPAARKALLGCLPKLPRIQNRYEAYRCGTRYFPQPPGLKTMLFAAGTVEPRTREIGLRDLYYFGLPEARTAAIAAAKDKLRSNGVALILIEILAAEGDEHAVAVLMPFADQRSPTVQARLIDLLGRIRDPGGIERLTKEVGARAQPQRLVAVRALARIPRPEVTGALAARLPREKDEQVLIALIQALAEHGGTRAVAALSVAAKRSERIEALRKPVMRALLKAGASDGAALEVFKTKLKSRSWEERLLALDAAAVSGRLDLAPDVIANLGHIVWQVRLVAARTLRRLRVAAAVQPLIERLPEEKEKRIRREVGRTLANLTGQNFGDRQQLWIRWWNDHRDTFQLPPPPKKKSKKKRGETRTVARFYGLPVESERVIFVIDQSGSMGSAFGSTKSQYRIAVEQVLYAIKRMNDRSRINVILFESAIHPWKKSLTRLGGSTRAQLTAHLHANGPMGGTNLYDGLAMALLTDKVDTVYLLSDGEPNGGEFDRSADILAAVTKINELRRITIHAVSIGRDSYLLKQLATQNGGEYVRK